MTCSFVNAWSSKVMKIAVVSEDGLTISQYIEREPFYIVFTIENSKVTRLEKRAESGLQKADIRIIDDCQVLIAGGMGWNAFASFKRHNIQPVLTNVRSIRKAVKLYAAGKLDNLIERLH